MLDKPLPANTLDFIPAAESLPAPAAPTPWLSRMRVFMAPRWTACWIVLAIFLLGVALRVTPRPGPNIGRTVDEGLYIINVKMLREVGLLEYPAIVENYVRVQSTQDTVMLPPTRCLYISLSYLWGQVFGTEDMMALRRVAAVFSILTLIISGIFAARLGGKWFGLGVFALMAVAPVEIQMAHRELVDGFFAFWALLSVWMLWENLQRPGRPWLLAAYAGSIAAMVLTKENAFFAFMGLGGIIALARPLKLGNLTRETVMATVLGGTMGVALLVFISGGVGMFLETYRLLVTKAERMDFAYQTGGGPWFRYIVDMMLMSPSVLLPAIGALFTLRKENKQAIAMLLFVACSYAIMTNVRNGMNLRYCTMWDMPLRYLAVGQLLQVSTAFRRTPWLAAIGLIALVGLVDLHQYYVFFIQHNLGELVSLYLMQALGIVRH